MVNRHRQDRRTYTFTLRVSDVVWTCIGAAFALTVFFLFGVLVGRGYVPVEEPQAAEESAVHGQLDPAQCDPQADPVNGRPVGSGIGASVAYVCDPVTAFCVLDAEGIPALR